MRGQLEDLNRQPATSMAASATGGKLTGTGQKHLFLGKEFLRNSGPPIQ
jgi:hypothetical protein